MAVQVKERRKSARSSAKVLVALRCLNRGKVTWSGFARTLNLSETGALLETPDRFHVDQDLSLEFLLDDDKILKVTGVITRLTRSKKMYHLGVTFSKVTARDKRLLAKQVKSQSQ